MSTTKKPFFTLLQEVVILFVILTAFFSVMGYVIWGCIVPLTFFGAIQQGLIEPYLPFSAAVGIGLGWSSLLTGIYLVINL